MKYTKLYFFIVTFLKKNLNPCIKHNENVSADFFLCAVDYVIMPWWEMAGIN